MHGEIELASAKLPADRREVGVVTDLRIYPVKGLRGHSVLSARVDPWGLEGDRRWLVVDNAGGFITQRKFPLMATIRADPVEGGLRLTCGLRDELIVPTPASLDHHEEVSVWNDRVWCLFAGNAAAEWLSGVLGSRCRLVYMDQPSTARPLARFPGVEGATVSFADGYPVLVTTTASLEALQAVVEPPALVMDRFRSNITVQTRTPWEEERWSSIRSGEVDFAAAKTCTRCSVITMDQDTGEALPRGEPLRSLARTRRDGRGRPIFGQNLVPLTAGYVRVGDIVSAAMQTP